MSKPFASYVDGYTSHSRETTVLPIIVYPFNESPIPDVRTQTLKRTYDVTPLTYTPRIAERAAVTNLLPYSEAITAANGWTLTNVTGTLNALNPAVATTTAYTFLETVTNAAHSIGRAATVAAAQYTLSLFVKASSRNFVRLQFTDFASTVFSGVFNIAEGQVFASTNATATFIRVRDGYFRLMVTFTPAAGVGASLFSFSTNGSTFSYVGDVTKGAVLWGAQLTLGGASVGYLPNNGAVTVRSAPDADTANPFAWLVQETDPVNETSSLARITRTLSMIPQTQVIPSSLLLTKPVLPLQVADQTVGSYYLNRPNSALESYDAYFIQTVTADSGIPTLYPTGGTYTLSFLTDTTSGLAFNASPSAIATALNLLTSVTTFGTVAVTGAYNSDTGIIVTFGAVAAGSINVASLTSTTGASVFGSVYESNSGMSKTFVVTTAHDASTPDFASSLTPTNAGMAVGQSFSPGFGFDVNSDFTIYFGTNTVATGGTFTLSVYGQTTAAITYLTFTSSSTLETNIAAALNALSNVIARGTYSVAFVGIANGVAIYNAKLSASAVTGGTFKITVLGQQTANIAYNASLSAISTAVNALSNVTAIGGAGVSGTNAQNFTVTLSPLPLIVANAGSLTVAPASITVSTPSSVSRVQTLIYAGSPPARVLSVPSHGIVQATDTIFLASGAVYYPGIAGGAAGGTYSVLDANTILLNVSSDASFVAAATILTIGKRTKADYRPGTTGIRCLKTTAFYLPGVSYGIDDFGDVPLPVNQSDAATFLQAVFAGTGNLNWQVGEIMPWMGAILQQTTTTIAIEDI